jgi:hypothetical protein
MAGLGGELKWLRKQLQEQPDYVTPMPTQAYLKQLERIRCVESGLEPPPFTDSEARYLYHQDTQNAAGGGAVGYYRHAPGWDTAKGNALIDAWQQEAQQRVQLVGELGEDWRSVYNDDLIADEVEENELLERTEEND